MANTGRGKLVVGSRCGRRRRRVTCMIGQGAALIVIRLYAINMPHGPAADCDVIRLCRWVRGSTTCILIGLEAEHEDDGVLGQCSCRCRLALSLDDVMIQLV